MLQEEEDSKIHHLSPGNQQTPVSSPSRRQPVNLDLLSTPERQTGNKAPPPESLMNIMNEQYEEQAINESRRDYVSTTIAVSVVYLKVKGLHV